MGETLKKLKDKFKPHKVPAMLADLCNYWDKNPNFFAGSFEVDIDQYDGVKEWFRNKEEGYSKVRVFGVDGIASIYALWLYEGRTAEDAPIVYLGGEGEGTTILANDFKDFFSILATNRDYEPFDKNFCDPEEENEEENKKFRKWAKEKYGISPARDPMKLMKAAKTKHPDFHKWLKSLGL